MLTERSTLTQFLIEERRRHPGSSGELNGPILDVALTCKAISGRIASGALTGVLGNAGQINVQGEAQPKLDVVANDIFLRANEWGGHLAGMASEELEEPYPIPSRYPRGKYLLAFDPLDGSSAHPRRPGTSSSREPIGSRPGTPSTGRPRFWCCPSGPGCTVSPSTRSLASSS